MEKCCKCNISAKERMLHRTNPTGQNDAGWMCEPCIEANEPELFANLKEEGKDNPILEDLKAICYPNQKQ